MPSIASPTDCNMDTMPPNNTCAYNIPNNDLSSSNTAEKPVDLSEPVSFRNDSSSSGGSEPIATDIIINNNQLAISDSNATLITPVPLTDQPTPEASQAPPDSKYGEQS